MNSHFEMQGVNIVLVGEFAPAMFHPAWFATHNLIRFEEAEASKIQAILSEVAVFRTEWLHVQVSNNRFKSETIQEPYFEALRDLTIGTFELLAYTPIKLVGINRDFHFSVFSEEIWHSIGHKLAPKAEWERVLSKPGMRNVTIQGARPDEYVGYIEVKVEPSRRFPNGVYVQINDHFDLQYDPEAPGGTAKLIEILSGQWAESMQRGEEIANMVVSLGEGAI